MSYFKKSQELATGDMFNAAPFAESEIKWAYDAGDVPDDTWADSFMQQAESMLVEVDYIEDSDDEEYVIVYAYPANIMLPIDIDVECE